MLTTPVLWTSTQLGLHIYSIYIYACQLMTRFRRPSVELLYVRTYCSTFTLSTFIVLSYRTKPLQCVSVMSELYLRHVSILLDTFSKCTHFALYTHAWCGVTLSTLWPTQTKFIFTVQRIYSIWGEMLMTHWWWVSSHIRPTDLCLLAHMRTLYEWTYRLLCDYSMMWWKIYSKLSVWILEIYDLLDGDGIYLRIYTMCSALLTHMAF